MAVITRMLQLVDGGAGEARAKEPFDRRRLRVAIASQDGKALDAHFGFARRLMVYDVTRRAYRFVQAFSFASDESPECDAEREDKVGPKLRALAGCQLLFALAIGPPAAAKVIGANIHPVKVAAPEPITSVLARVQAMMNGEPPQWMKKILEQPTQNHHSRRKTES